MPNVYFIGLFAVLIVSGLAGSYIKGRSDGADITKSEYAARDVKAASDYAAKERELTDAARKKEGEWAKSAAETSRKYQRELDKNATDYLTILATHPQLRDPGSHSAACGNTASATAPNTGAPDAGDYILSPETGAFLWDQAAAADRTRLKLNSCIDLLESERR